MGRSLVFGCGSRMRPGLLMGLGIASHVSKTRHGAPDIFQDPKRETWGTRSYPKTLALLVSHRRPPAVERRVPLRCDSGEAGGVEMRSGEERYRLGDSANTGGFTLRARLRVCPCRRWRNPHCGGRSNCAAMPIGPIAVTMRSSIQGYTAIQSQ